jgi:hypothetical protein
LSDPLDLHSKYFISDLRVFVTLGDLSPRWNRLSESHQGCGGPRKVCIALSFVGDLIVETELDLSDRSDRIRVEKDPTLCELLNGDIGNLYDWPNFGNKSCVSCACLF